MLKEILSITGKPGLYRMLTPGKRTLLVEDMVSKKRFPLGARDRVVCLGDIAMYTVGEDLPLGEILDRVYAVEDGKTVEVKAFDADGLREEFAKAVADFDRDRVYPSDIKKLFTWYNLLVSEGYSKFTEKSTTNEVEQSEGESK